MARSTYVALYKAVMNINEDGRRPHGWHDLEGDRWIKRDTPTDVVSGPGDFEYSIIP